MYHRFNILSLLVLFLSSCSYSIKSIVEKSESLVGESKKINQQPIFYLEPEIDLFNISSTYTNNYLLTEQINNTLNIEIKRRAKHYKIKILQPNMFNFSNLTNIEKTKYLSLKRRILVANRIQDNPLNYIERKTDKPFVQQVFTTDPFIGYDYADLAKTLGTEMVGIIGVYSFDIKNKDKTLIQDIYSKYGFKNKCFIQYHYIVNLITGNIIYTEFRLVDKKLTPTYLYTTIYDSFYLLKKNLKQ